MLSFLAIWLLPNHLEFKILRKSCKIYLFWHIIVTRTWTLQPLGHFKVFHNFISVSDAPNTENTLEADSPTDVNTLMGLPQSLCSDGDKALPRYSDLLIAYATWSGKLRSKGTRSVIKGCSFGAWCCQKDNKTNSPRHSELMLPVCILSRIPWSCSKLSSSWTLNWQFFAIIYTVIVIG